MPMPTRAHLIKIVQTGRTRLGLDEETYRDLLAAKSAGKRSARDLSAYELEAVIRHLRASGFAPAPPKARTAHVRRALDPSAEARKARAIWLWLHQIGIVRDPDEAALAAFAKRISGVDALQWTARPDKVIEGLKAWAARQLPAKIDTRIARLAAAGRMPAGLTAHRLAEHISPRLNPAGFDSLRWAWEHLDAIEAEERAG